jgi:hypothetical protein
MAAAPGTHTGHTLTIATVIDMSGAQIYRKTSTVHAMMLTQSLTLWLPHGKQDLKVGDYVLIDNGVSISEPATMWGCNGDLFHRTYEPVPEGHPAYGRFRKKTFIKAMQMSSLAILAIVDSDHPEYSKAGDWLVVNIDADEKPVMKNGLEDRYFISDEKFRAMYTLRDA